MAEIPKEDSEAISDEMTMVKMMNGSNGKSDAFIVDLECFSNGGLDKDVSSKSRMNQMQRSFSRKVPLPGGGHDQESLLISSSSPKVGPAGSNSTLEKVAETPVVVAMGANDPSSNERDHQPTIETGNLISYTIASKSRWRRRYNSFKRSPQPHWFSDPKRVLLFFATLSSLGTILLIYFTLSMSKSYKNVDSNPEWET